MGAGSEPGCLGSLPALTLTLSPTCVLFFVLVMFPLLMRRFFFFFWLHPNARVSSQNRDQMQATIATHTTAVTALDP